MMGGKVKSSEGVTEEMKYSDSSSVGFRRDSKKKVAFKTKC